ncbi:F-box/LRR-repeat protein 12-like [Amphiura filiformis]|uniref:F-box/LRR-repeat protein 12-like n=1 Tax=Amphiura filiformis TaxID=82378 RepID=UPI003B210137
MGQVKSRRSGLTKSTPNDDPACIINILIDDVLFKIFSLLTISEKLTASRTCKRWHSLIKDPHVWQTVDFWNGYNLDSPYQSEQDEAKYIKQLTNTTMRILQSYTDSSLRVVYLRASNRAVMRYLTKKCPNLQTLSFLSPDQHTPYSCNKDIIKYFPKIDFALPLQLEKLQLSFVANRNCTYDDDYPTRELRMVSIRQFRDTVIPRILQCQNLRHLTLYKCNEISPEDVEILTSGLPKLQELCLLYFTTSSFATRDHAQPAVLEEILRIIVDNLPDLTSLHIITAKYYMLNELTYVAGAYSIDNILQELCNRHKFTDLHVTEALFNPVSFATMTQALPNMTELGLYDCNCVTDEIMKIIARDLSNLEILLLNDSGPYTDIGLKALQYHPSLQSLTIFKERRQPRHSDRQILSTEVIFETLMSLPKLKEAKLLKWGCRVTHDIIFQRYLNELRAIKPHVRICTQQYRYHGPVSCGNSLHGEDMRKQTFFPY